MTQTFDEQLEAQFRDDEPESPVVEEPEADEEPAEPEPAPEVDEEPEAEEPAPETESLVEVPMPDGSRVSIAPSQLSNYVRFMNWAQTNPDGWEDLVAWERGDKVLVPAAQPPQAVQQPPDDDDDEWVDPDERLEQLQRTVAELQSRIDEQRFAEDRATLAQGVARFRESHKDLAADDLERVYERARDLELVPRYVASNPYDRASAISEAFEAAYRLVFFDRHTQEAGKQVTEQMRSRRRAAAAGSSPRSAPRVAPEPQTQQERDAAMTAEIAEAMQAN